MFCIYDTFMKQLGIFYEPQRGGLCRLHSINAFFGKSKINEKEFREYAAALDKETSQKYHMDIKSLDFDSVSADQNMLVSYILKRHGITTRYIPIDYLRYNKLKLEDQVNDIIGDFFFVFNPGHIWGMRRKDNIWYKVDSIGGVRKIGPHTRSVGNQKNLGFIIPVDSMKEFYINVERIKKIIGPHTDDTIDTIEKYLKKINEKKEILGEIEVPLGISMDIIEAISKRQKDENPGFDSIFNLIELYREFLSKFTPGQYHNLDLKLKYLPKIIQVLISLTTTIS